MDVKKICVVMAYHERQYQLTKTLKTIDMSAYSNFSVVIVDDCSNEDIILPELGYEVDIIKLEEKSWSNCAPVYNYGFIHAISKGADTIIIQSAECYHAGDIISHVAMNIRDDNYIAYGCFRLDRNTTFSEHDIMSLSKANAFMVNSENNGNGQNAWWNHSVYSPLPQYWCAAITVDNLKEINGIDERFAYGFAFEDGRFLQQVASLGLNTEIVDFPFVAHQWHTDQKEDIQDFDAKYERNKSIYLRMRETDDYKSIHYITPNL